MLWDRECPIGGRLLGNAPQRPFSLRARHQVIRALSCHSMHDINAAHICWPHEITTICAARSWSLRALAREVGVSANYLSEIANEKRPASLAVKIKLASLIGWEKSHELLVKLLPDDAAQAWAFWD